METMAGVDYEEQQAIRDLMREARGKLNDAWVAVGGRASDRYVERISVSDGVATIWVKHPVSADPNDLAHEVRRHPVVEAVKLLAAADGPEAELERRAHELQQAAEERIKARLAIDAKWRALSPVARTFYALAAKTADRGARQMLLSLAREAAQLPNEAEPAIPDWALQFEEFNGPKALKAKE